MSPQLSKFTVPQGKVVKRQKRRGPGHLTLPDVNSPTETCFEFPLHGQLPSLARLLGLLPPIFLRSLFADDLFPKKCRFSSQKKKNPLSLAGYNDGVIMSALRRARFLSASSFLSFWVMGLRSWENSFKPSESISSSLFFFSRSFHDPLLVLREDLI